MRTHTIPYILIFLSAIILSASTPDVENPEIKSDKFSCDSILIAEYSGCRTTEQRTHQKQIEAIYYPRCVLKGPPCGRGFRINYALEDLSTQALQKSEKEFGKKVVPVKGSMWILFIPRAVLQNGLLETFEGSNGRLECTLSNLKAVKEGLETVENKERVLDWDKILRLYGGSTSTKSK